MFNSYLCLNRKIPQARARVKERELAFPSGILPMAAQETRRLHRTECSVNRPRFPRPTEASCIPSSSDSEKISMESDKGDDLKRKRDDSSKSSTSGRSSSDEGEFEIPKEHIRLAKRREKASRPEALIQKNQSNTSITDIRNVLFWILSDTQGSIPKWCIIKNKHLVESVTVVVTPFLDRLTLFELAGNSAGVQKDLPFFSHCIRGSMIPMYSVGFHRYPAICPVLSSFLSTPYSSKALKWVEKLSDDEEVSNEHEGNYHPKITEFLMTEEMRRSNGIPESLSNGLAPPGFVTTKGKKTRSVFEGEDPEDLPPMVYNERDLRRIEVDDDYRNLIAIDCEMVETCAGKELARVSLVDYMGRVLYDSIVLPENEIEDYLTQYSGITRKMMMECRKSFREAQKDVLKYLDESSILVGHAIDNDLRCLKLIHNRIIDTSDIFPHPNGHPSKHSLVFLLQRVIRASLDRERGHDSVDDARATLRVALKKLARGHDYSPNGLNSSKLNPLGELIDGRSVLISELDDHTQYKTQGMDINPSEFDDAKLRIHVLRQFQHACENNTPRKDALIQIDSEIRSIASKMQENHVLLVFSGCGDIHSFKRFEQLADMCDDEVKMTEVTKALERAKDKALAAYAIITAISDLPLEVRNA